MWDSSRKDYFEKRGLPAPRPGVLGQALHGLLLPLHLARAIWSDPAGRRRYLLVSIAQVATIVGLGLLFMGSGRKVLVDAADEQVEREATREEQARRQEERRQVAEQLRRELGHTAQALTDAGLGERLDARGLGQRLETAGERLQQASALDEQLAQRQELQLRRERVRRWRKATVMDLEFWAALLAAMHFTQWAVIALSRDYHDAIARDVSLRTGLEPEDGPLRPRIRLNLGWLRTKLKRRWRSLLAFGAGMPLLWLLALLLPGSRHVLPVLTFGWGAWWWMVFTASKSGRSWRDEATAPAPWFLRGWQWLTTNVPGLRWGLPRGYGNFWAKYTRYSYAPSECVEQQPWVFAGLALARTLVLVPGVKCLIRPLIPVASAHLLEAHRAAQPAALPEPALVTEPAPLAEPAPRQAAALEGGGLHGEVRQEVGGGRG